MFYVIVGGLLFLAVLFIGAIATMMLPILIGLVFVVVLLWKIYEAVAPAAPEIAEKTCEIANTISQFLC